tara:strand:- start:58 stop:774 length:717 start_codon:yes stop_codon:yes gene_type:complete
LVPSRKTGSRSGAPTTTSRPQHAPTSRRDTGGRVGIREEHHANNHHIVLAEEKKKSKMKKINDNMNKKARKIKEQMNKNYPRAEVANTEGPEFDYLLHPHFLKRKSKSHLTLGNVQAGHMRVRGDTAPFSPETQKRSNRTKKSAQKMAANDERRTKKAEAKGKMSSANAARDKKGSIAAWTKKYNHAYEEEESPSIDSRPRFERWGSPSGAQLGARLAREKMENTRPPKVNTRSKVKV